MQLSIGSPIPFRALSSWISSCWTWDIPLFPPLHVFQYSIHATLLLDYHCCAHTQPHSSVHTLFPIYLLLDFVAKKGTTSPCEEKNVENLLSYIMKLNGVNIECHWACKHIRPPPGVPMFKPTAWCQPNIHPGCDFFSEYAWTGYFSMSCCAPSSVLTVFTAGKEPMTVNSIRNQFSSEKREHCWQLQAKLKIPTLEVQPSISP